MKLTFYIFKKWMALALCATMPFMTFVMTLVGARDLGYAIVFTIFVILIICIVGNKLLRHPYSALVEGSGIQAFVIDSTGVIGSFVADMPKPPKIRGRISKQDFVTDIYERDLIHTILTPKKGKLVTALEVNTETGEKKQITVLKMPAKDDFNKLFVFTGKPTFIFNRTLDMFIGKDFLSRMETKSTLLHSVNHLISLIKNLSRDVDPFAKYVVEQTRPKKGWFAGKGKVLAIVIIVVIVLLMIAIFIPSIISGFSNVGQQVVPTNQIP